MVTILLGRLMGRGFSKRWSDRRFEKPRSNELSLSWFDGSSLLKDVIR
jgi:hypothetical protein